MKLLSRLFLIALVALPLVITFTDTGNKFFVRAEGATDDVLEEEEASVEEETASDLEQGEDGSTSEEEKVQGSKDIDITLLFTNPVGTGQELPAGKPVELLMGIVNNGDQDFILDAAEASFRYPMDFNFHIQNFTVTQYNKIVRPRHEATVMYNFFPAEVFAGRPLGLQVNLAYHDAEGIDYVESVFNSTINVVEIDEGLDGETFFLYVFMLAFVVGLLLLGHWGLTSLGVAGKKTGEKKQQQSKSSQRDQVEVGTAHNGVDFDWLPDHIKADLKKKSSDDNGVKAPVRSSPRLRNR